VDVFQCDRSLKSVVSLDQKHTTANEWICHSLVRARNNIVREYQIHMFNHRMADIPIGCRTRRAYCGDNTMNEYWSLWAPNKFSKSQYTSQFVICLSPLLRQNFVLVNQRTTCVDLGTIVEFRALGMTKNCWILNIRSRRNWIKHVYSLICAQNEYVLRVLIKINQRTIINSKTKHRCMLHGNDIG
jgi:hypothetical protein